MRKNSNFILLFFFLLQCLLTGLLWSQKLVNIRKEIRQLEQELNIRELKERTVLEQLEDLDREVGLRKKLIEELEAERIKSEKEIAETSRNLKQATQNIFQLRESVAQRIKTMYMRGRLMDWEALLSMSSFSQVLVWMKYQVKIIENDHKNILQLQRKETEVKIQKEKLELELRQKESLIQEKKSEGNKLEDMKATQNRLLVQVRKDIQSVIEQIQRKRQAYKNIEKQIRQQDKKRKETPIKTVQGKFSQLKGTLIWPVPGKIVSKYGKHKHPVLKTWTENIGVDIETADGGLVRSVGEGVVWGVTWMRGMGNIVLIDNGDGYHTVYGHLESVYMNSGDSVTRDSVIGRVGDSHGLYGSTLHFEIWKDRDHINPENWLR